VVGIPDLITYANFGDDRLRGLGVAGGKSLPFSIDFDRRPYNTLALPCECVNYASIFYLLRVIASYLSKVADFNLPHLHLAPPLRVTAFEFCRDFRQRKTRVPELSCERCDVICVFLRLAVSVEHWLVTDGRTDRRWQLIPDSVVWVKTSLAAV